MKIEGSGSTFVRGMDPRIRIRTQTKMSWIRNTGKNLNVFAHFCFRSVPDPTTMFGIPDPDPDH